VLITPNYHPTANPTQLLELISMGTFQSARERGFILTQ
jgi:hypothetical protein